jgi:hypothetical protein
MKLRKADGRFYSFRISDIYIYQKKNLLLLLLHITSHFSRIQT